MLLVTGDAKRLMLPTSPNQVKVLPTRPHSNFLPVFRATILPFCGTWRRIPVGVWLPQVPRNITIVSERLGSQVAIQIYEKQPLFQGLKQFLTEQPKSSSGSNSTHITLSSGPTWRQRPRRSKKRRRIFL